MNVTTALLRVKRQFGDEYDVLINDDDIYGWFHDAELDIIRNTGCNDVTINVAQSAFPSNVPDSVNILRVAVNGTALQYITKDELDLLSISDAAVGGPSYWYMDNKKVTLWPWESTTQQIAITYNKVPATLTGDPTGLTFTVPEVYHEDVVKFAVARAHNKNHDMQAEKAQMDLYNQNLSIRKGESQGIDAPLYKGDDPMDYDYGWS